MKTVMIFNNDDLEEMLAKSNLWYVRHYEEYFDQVYAMYLRGRPHEPVVRGRTTLISLATGRGKLDFLLAPYRLYKFAKQHRPSVYITLDIIWSWWLAILLRLFLHARIYLSPQFTPSLIYRTSKHSVSGIMPIWLERFSIWLSYHSAGRMLSGRCFENYVRWLSENPVTAKKLVVTDTLVEALPPPDFLEKLESLNGSRGDGRRGPDEDLNLIYVGRLQRQKLVDDLIRMMSLIGRPGAGAPAVRLTLVGDGPERGNLEKLADELGVRPSVNFAGQVRNDQLPEYLLRSHVYVSPLTGMSLREAAVCGLPIVAYDMDWIQGLLKHEETALLVAPGDYAEMGRQVLRLASDEALRRKLSANVGEVARRLWSAESLRESLRAVFEEAGRAAPRPRLKSSH